MSNLYVIQGAISSKIGELTLTILNDLTNPSKYKITDLVKILENDPVVYACSQLKSARISTLLGSYKNKNKEHQDFIQYNFENMEDTLPTLAGKLGSSCPLGFSNAEINFKVEKFKFNSKWVLNSFNFLDPTHVTFRIQKGEPVDLKYQNGHQDVFIPLWKVIHVVNSLNTCFGAKSLYGSPELARAYPYVKLKQLIFGELAIATKNRAGGILFGQADSSTQVLDPDDTSRQATISAVQSLARQLAQLENSNVLVTDKMNNVSSLPLPAGEQFWNFAKSLVDEQIMRSLMIPEMIWNEGSGALGVGSLSNTQLSILDSSLLMVVQLIRDQLIEKVVRPLIYYNFGKADDYGEFVYTAENDPSQENLVTQGLMSALSSGLIQNTDYTAINSLRERLKLPPIDPDIQMQQIQMQQQMQMLSQPPQMQNVPEEE